MKKKWKMSERIERKWENYVFFFKNKQMKNDKIENEKKEKLEENKENKSETKT